MFKTLLSSYKSIVFWFVRYIFIYLRTIMKIILTILRSI